MQRRRPPVQRSRLLRRLGLARVVIVLFSAIVVSFGASWAFSGIAQGISAQRDAAVSAEVTGAKTALASEFAEAVAGVHFVTSIADPSGRGFVLDDQVAAVLESYARAEGDLAGLAIVGRDGRTLWHLGAALRAEGVAGYVGDLEVGPLVPGGHNLDELVGMQASGPDQRAAGQVLALVQLAVPRVAGQLVVTSTSARPIELVGGRAHALTRLPQGQIEDISPLGGLGAAVGVMAVPGQHARRALASVVVGALVVFVLLVVGGLLVIQLAAYGEERRARARVDAEAARLEEGIAEASWTARSRQRFVEAVQDLLQQRFAGLEAFAAVVREEPVVTFGEGVEELLARAELLGTGESVVVQEGASYALARRGGGGELLVARATPGDVVCPLSVLAAVDIAVLVVGLEQAIVSGERMRMAHALESLGTPVFVAERSGVITWTNPILEEVFGWRPGMSLEELLGESWRVLTADEERSLVGADGLARWVRVAISEVLGDGLGAVVGVLEDRTLARLENERLTYRSTHDALTGALNRVALEAIVTAEIEGEVSRGSFWVGVLDLDGFKPINDTFGHAVGDEVLRATAARLRAALEGVGEVARFGGDEFVLVVWDPARERSLPMALAVVFDEAVVLAEGFEVRLGGSLGIARWPEHGATFDQLVREADRALYWAKSAKGGRGRWWLFCDEVNGEQGGFEDAFGPRAARWLDAGGRLVAEAVEALAIRLRGTHDLPERGVDLEGRDCVACQVAVITEALAPGAQSDVLMDRAREVGRRLALAGATASDLDGLVATTLELMRAQAPPGALVDRLVGISRIRLQGLINAELAAMVELRWQYLSTMLELPRPEGQAPSIWGRELLEMLAFLPGIQLGILIATKGAEWRPFVEAVGRDEEAVARWLAREEHTGLLDPERTVGPGDGQRAWHEGRVVCVDDLTAEPQYARYRELAEALGVRSIAICPIHLGDHPVGLVVLGGELSGMFGTLMVRQLLDALAPTLARGFEEIAARVQGAPAGDDQRARLAVLEGGILSYAQPIVGLGDGLVHQVELLVRLRGAGGRVMAPAEFLDALGPRELSAIFLAQLDRAWALLPTWRSTAKDLRVAVNVGATTLADPLVADRLRALGRDGGLDWLVLEVLESDSGRLGGVVEEFLGFGAQLAIDDLGSGFSNLERLVDLPLWEVKIDRSLVSRLRSAPTISTAVLAGLVQGAHDMERLVVFEGVEDADLVEAARVLEADLVQGYHFARPMAIEEMGLWLERREGVPPSGALTTWVGAIAACWRESVIGPGQPGDDGVGCALGEFLFRQDGAGMLARLHQSFHRQGRARGQTFRDLLAGLEARLEAQASSQPLAAAEE